MGVGKWICDSTTNHDDNNYDYHNDFNNNNFDNNYNGARQPADHVTNDEIKKRPTPRGEPLL